MPRSTCIEVYVGISRVDVSRVRVRAMSHECRSHEYTVADSRLAHTRLSSPNSHRTSIHVCLLLHLVGVVLGKAGAHTLRVLEELVGTVVDAGGLGSASCEQREGTPRGCTEKVELHGVQVTTKRGTRGLARGKTRHCEAAQRCRETLAGTSTCARLVNAVRIPAVHRRCA